jgi:hypothetical protein
MTGRGTARKFTMRLSHWIYLGPFFETGPAIAMSVLNPYS